MFMADLKAKEYERFEDIKHTTDEGVEFWYARELGPVLDYAKWDNFRKVIDAWRISISFSRHRKNDKIPTIKPLAENAGGFFYAKEREKIKKYSVIYADPPLAVPAE